MQTIVNFNSVDELRQRLVVNDTVMRGRSGNGMLFDGDHGGFGGNLSLRNNDGFASVRRAWPDLADGSFDTLHLRFIDDGLPCQLRFRTSGNRDGVAYAKVFETEAGLWQELSSTAADFTPVFRGRVIRRAGPLNLDSERQAGLMLADKQPGPFQLTLDYLSVSLSEFGSD